jgi:hypothetical protein
MPPTVLTQRHLNRALLARQQLLERGTASLPKTLELIGGIQAQYAPSMYIGLWSRLEGFQRDQLTRALQRRTVVQGTLLRITIHLVSAADWWPFAVAVREERRKYLLRAHKEHGDARKQAASGRKIRKRVAGTTMTQAEMRELLGEAGGGLSAATWIDLVRVPPSGTWERRRADIHAAAEDWLGSEGADIAVDDAVDHLVRSALRGFGPMSAADAASFAGLTKPTVAASLERLELRRFEDEQGGELVDLPRAPLPDPETPAPVRFLPVWDATMLLATIKRTGIFPEPHRQALANSNYPQASPLFLVDGVAAGVWQFENGRVQIDPFRKLDRATMRELRDEADRLSAFHA